jgi:hypothetical protein
VPRRRAARGLRDEHRLTDEHQQVILAAIPPHVTAKANWAKLEEKVWSDLDQIIAGYRMLNSRRRNYPIAAKRRRYDRMADLTKKLAAELRIERRETPWSDPDPLWPNRALAALWDVHNKVQVRSAWHETWAAFRGTQNPYREFLYWGILRVWTDRLGGELKYSMSRKGKPVGPLVRFFTACVEPVLGPDETPRTGIADIIERERESRRRTNCFKQKLGRIGV